MLHSARVNFLIGLLKGKALRWAQALSDCTDLGTLTFDELENNFKAVFDHSNHAGTATEHLFTIRQGPRSVAEYAVDFWTLAVDAGWNEPALEGAFRRGLNRPVRDALALRSRPRDLNVLVAVAIELDNHLRGQRQVIWPTIRLTPLVFSPSAGSTWVPTGLHRSARSSVAYPVLR